MPPYNLYITLSFLICVIGVALGVLNFFINTNNCDKIAKITRERYIASIIWAGCLAWCIPHTEVIIFKVLVPYLWYIAIALVILSFKFLDYLFARAFAGACIIGGYVMVNFGFTFHTRIPVILSITAWIIGIIGIVISARPSLLRDLIRLNSKNKKIKISSSVILFVISAVMLLNGLLEISK